MGNSHKTQATWAIRRVFFLSAREFRSRYQNVQTLIVIHFFFNKKLNVYEFHSISVFTVYATVNLA